MKFTQKLKKWNSIFCRGMACKVNVKRDIAVILSLAIVAAVFLYFAIPIPAPQRGKLSVSGEQLNDSSKNISEEEAVRAILTEEEIAAEAEKLASRVETNGWKTFRNQFWGFAVQYPTGWMAPATQKKLSASKWEARYQFRKKEPGGEAYLGFDVAIYDVSKTKELQNTEEYPAIKSDGLKTDSRCQNIEGHAIEVDEFPAEEIYISPNDDCFNPALFFTIIKEQYIFNIVPIPKSGPAGGNDPRISINENFPEYYAAVSTFNLIDIVRPKPAPPKPKITAPKPVSFKAVGGKLVCAKKKDKPRKSRQNKGKHLDMECCLDPDEYPNPWCAY